MRSEKFQISPSLRRGLYVQSNMTPESIRAQVRKIIASRAMARSERLARFLDFTVSETLDGHADQLKEFVIGVEVFDRRQDYDPRLDPIVRVEARRLRMKLRKYYEGEGREDKLRIEFPKGSYAPAIRVEHAAPVTGEVRETRRAIAILPFVNIDVREECEYFIDGFTEEVIDSLTKVEGLRVVAWSSSLKLKGTPRDYARIGEQLNVDVVLEGSIRHGAPGTMRVAVQLVSVRDGSYLWTESYDKPVEESCSVRDAIASAVARALRVKLTAPKSRARNIEAYHFYLKGRYHWNKRTDEAVQLGAGYLEQAIATDPGYALAYAGWADCQVVLAKFGTVASRDAMPKARSAAKRALALDSTLAEPHVALGSIASLFDWDWTAAEQHYRLAIQMNPGYATAHQWYAHDYLAGVGRLEEAEAELALARDCDPLSVVILASSAENVILQRRPQEALDFYAKTLELDSYFPRAYFGLARTLLLLGRRDEAVDAIERGFALNPGSPLALATRISVYGALGRIAEARRMLTDLEAMAQTTRVAPYLMMRAWMTLDVIRSCEFLEQACEDRDPRLIHAGASPIYDPLRGSSCFESVLRRMGLAAEPVPA
ncbi:MAG TPA: tetratricopeptide repeat protein [Bryobacteraceae bacterium]|nr:tetratricopeptide repeat protein [Bryobacteraceae bacterium]